MNVNGDTREQNQVLPETLLRGLQTCWLTLSYSEAADVLLRESVISDIIFTEEGVPRVLCSSTDRSYIR